MISNVLVLCMPIAVPPVAFTQEAEPEATTLQEALMGGRTWLNFNFRYETADQDVLDKEAHAATLRTALGYESASYRGFRGLVEFEDISNIGNDLFNSTINGETGRPVVADPDSTEVNQAYAAWAPNDSFEAKLGRQEMAFGNHRFIGTVAWRQNHQSFDAARADWTDGDGTTVTYAYLDSVRRIFGEDSPKGMEKMSSHLVDIRRSLDGIGDLAAYGYYLDFDKSEAVSSLTLGLRLSGSQELDEKKSLLYTAEFATQEDAADNPIEIDSEYWLAEVGLDLGPAVVRLGNEHLGGSGDAGDKFSTPLATLHKFNGFADLFLTTPDEGLEDYYLSVSGKLGEVNCALTYHVFESDADSIDYGDELNFTAVYPLNERTKLGAKWAQFNSDDRYTDTQRAMAWISYRML